MKQGNDRERIKKFMLEKKYLDNSITLSKMATYVDINPVYLNNLLKEIYGRTYITLINDLRLNDFVSSIKKDSSSLKKFTISAVVKTFGFNSYTTFLYSFRRKYKSSPREYLKDYL